MALAIPLAVNHLQIVTLRYEFACTGFNNRPGRGNNAIGR